MAKVTVKEGSTSYHPIEPVDKDGAVVTPEALRYKVTAGDGTVLVPWTTIPASTIEIEVSAAANTVTTGGNRRILTIEATHNGGDKITAEATYTLENLVGV